MAAPQVRVLITGADGQLASEVTSTFRDAAVLPLSRTDLDITDAAAVRACVLEWRPTVIVNCAAYNYVDRAEDEPEIALAVNAFGVRALARAAAQCDTTLVHYSSDFVFDGSATRPYTEEDDPNPQSVYAATKLLGEWFALGYPRGFVLRVASLFGGHPAKSSVDRIVDALLEGRPAPVFTDRVVSPSYVVDVAAATRAVVERGAPGLYHCVSTGHCTWHELGVEVARLVGGRGNVLVPTISEDIPLRAARPRYAALCNARLTAITPVRGWREALAAYVESRRSERRSE